MGMADEVRGQASAEASRRQAEDQAATAAWAATRKDIDELAPEVVASCSELRLKQTKLTGGLLAPKAWTFVVRADGPGEAWTTMHLGFYSNGKWTLLGYGSGTYIVPVDPARPVTAGSRHGFMERPKSSRVDVVFELSKQQIRQQFVEQMRNKQN